jgi:hypothetical protein
VIYAPIYVFLNHVAFVFDSHFQNESLFLVTPLLDSSILLAFVEVWLSEKILLSFLCLSKVVESSNLEPEEAFLKKLVLDKTLVTHLEA